MSIKTGKWFLLLLLAWCSLPSPGFAVSVFNKQLPNNLFGNLNQNDVPACKDDKGNSFSCGAVAAVNSFAFLERQYPQYYDHSLIPDANSNGTFYEKEDLVAAATEVA